jgi:hypothetical protein
MAVTLALTSAPPPAAALRRPPLQALLLRRFQHVVDGAALEGFHRVGIVGGDEHDVALVADDAAASMPVLPGMRISRKVKSGLSSSTRSMASSPFFANNFQLGPDLAQAHAQLVAHQTFVICNDCCRHRVRV